MINVEALRISQPNAVLLQTRNRTSRIGAHTIVGNGNAYAGTGWWMLPSAEKARLRPKDRMSSIARNDATSHVRNSHQENDTLKPVGRATAAVVVDEKAKNADGILANDDILPANVAQPLTATTAEMDIQLSLPPAEALPRTDEACGSVSQLLSAAHRQSGGTLPEPTTNAYCSFLCFGVYTARITRASPAGLLSVR